MPTKKLSDRQRQCVILSATMTDKEIGRALGVSPGTVNKHIQEAMERLGVNTRKNALRALGYVTPSPSDPVPAADVSGPTGGAETDDVATSRTPGPAAAWRYSPPPRGRALRLAVAFAFFLVGSIVAIGGAAVLNAGLGLTQAMAPSGVR
ncbi:helix-turn-helix transcriptional regulator [Brevundimonas staleyi]|uniref:Helix-turn-helix transcriptional regulator n=1 Tax=Brevundimonas staleyi TaxID=74326 RepID=A0ABW0FUN1_9CAUL